MKNFGLEKFLSKANAGKTLGFSGQKPTQLDLCIPLLSAPVNLQRIINQTL